MRLLAEIISRAPARINPCGDYELDLRGLRIPQIENLGLTENLYDAIDLSDNSLTTLDNIPLLRRLRCLLLSGNRLASISSDVPASIPFIDTLVLSNNRLSALQDILDLSPLPRLSMLFLLGNPVTRKECYRQFTISRFPSLRVLDGQRVTRKERIDAVKWTASKKGKAFVKGVLEEREKRLESVVPVGVQGRRDGGGRLAGFSSAALGLKGVKFDGGIATESSRVGTEGVAGKIVVPLDVTERLQAAIARAKTAAEIDLLETALKNGNIVEVLDKVEGKHHQQPSVEDTGGGDSDMEV